MNSLLKRLGLNFHKNTWSLCWAMENWEVEKKGPEKVSICNFLFIAKCTAFYAAASASVALERAAKTRKNVEVCFIFCFLCSAVMNGIKKSSERMHLRHFFLQRFFNLFLNCKVNQKTPAKKNEIR